MSIDNQNKFFEPADYIKHLSVLKSNLNRTHLCLESLKVKLNTKPISWITEFGIRGLEVLLNILNGCYQRDLNYYNKLQLECICCLRAIMNRSQGIDLVFDKKETLTMITRSLNVKKSGIMIEAVQILAALCFIPPDGHDRVLDAITKSAGKSERFKPLIQGLAERGDQNLKLHCMILINAILTRSHDLDNRLLLRDEIMRAGFGRVLKELEKDATLSVQIGVFKEWEQNDFLEILEVDASPVNVSRRSGNVKDALTDSSAWLHQPSNITQEFGCRKRFKVDMKTNNKILKYKKDLEE